MSWMMFLNGHTEGYADDDGKIVIASKSGHLYLRDDLGCDAAFKIKREFGWWKNCFFLKPLFCRCKDERFSDGLYYIGKKRMRRIVRICEKILSLQGIDFDGWGVPEDVVISDKTRAFMNKVFLGDIGEDWFSHRDILYEIKKTRNVFKHALEVSPKEHWRFEIDCD